MKKVLLGLITSSFLLASEGGSKLAVGAMVESGHSTEYNVALKYGHYEANFGANVVNIGYVAYENEIASHTQLYVTTGLGMVYASSANVQMPIGLDYHINHNIAIFAEVIPEYTFKTFESTSTTSHDTTTSHSSTGYGTNYAFGARYSF